MNRLVLFALLLVYCLVLGPAEWLRIHDYLSAETVCIIFDPPLWLIDNDLMPEWLAARTLWFM